VARTTSTVGSIPSSNGQEPQYSRLTIGPQTLTTLSNMDTGPIPADQLRQPQRAVGHPSPHIQEVRTWDDRRLGSVRESREATRTGLRARADWCDLGAWACREVKQA